MALVILPPDHHDADLTLASRIAARLDLEELHVFANVNPTAEQPAAPEQRGAVNRFLAAVDELFDRLADALAPWSASPRR